jgi:hypothetical protein
MLWKPAPSCHPRQCTVGDALRTVRRSIKESLAAYKFAVSTARIAQAKCPHTACQEKLLGENAGDKASPRSDEKTCPLAI